MATPLDPQVTAFVDEYLYESMARRVSKERSQEIARKVQQTLVDWIHQELDHDDELRTLKGYTDEERERI